jgi:hypothetical protein
MAQSLVIDLIALRPQLIDDILDLKHVPSDDGVVQHRWATERHRVNTCTSQEMHVERRFEVIENTGEWRR